MADNRKLYPDEVKKTGEYIPVYEAAPMLGYTPNNLYTMYTNGSHVCNFKKLRLKNGKYQIFVEKASINKSTDDGDEQ